MLYARHHARNLTHIISLVYLYLVYKQQHQPHHLVEVGTTTVFILKLRKLRLKGVKNLAFVARPGKQWRQVL